MSVDQGTSAIIDRKLKHLRDRVVFLRGHQGVSQRDFLQDQTLQLAVEHAFQEAIEACLDISRRALIDAGIPLPDKNRDILAEAARLGAAPADDVERLADMAGFGNVLVHEYEKIDPLRVHDALARRLDDLDAFAAVVVAHLERQQP